MTALRPHLFKLCVIGLLLVVGVTALVDSVTGSSSGRRSSSPPPPPAATSSSSSSADSRPGAASVYAEIEGATSCTRLQRMFDTAWSNNRREQPLTDLYEASLSYMEAINDRETELGCP